MRILEEHYGQVMLARAPFGCPLRFPISPIELLRNRIKIVGEEAGMRR
jgi:hypothetical protein